MEARGQLWLSSIVSDLTFSFSFFFFVPPYFLKTKSGFGLKDGGRPSSVREPESSARAERVHAHLQTSLSA